MLSRFTSSTDTLRSAETKNKGKQLTLTTVFQNGCMTYRERGLLSTALYCEGNEAERQVRLKTSACLLGSPLLTATKKDASSSPLPNVSPSNYSVVWKLLYTFHQQIPVSERFILLLLLCGTITRSYIHHDSDFRCSSWLLVPKIILKRLTPLLVLAHNLTLENNQGHLKKTKSQHITQEQKNTNWRSHHKVTYLPYTDSDHRSILVSIVYSDWQ